MGDIVVVDFFFFKQKTAYEMLRSLVGSEMCIRDRAGGGGETGHDAASVVDDRPGDVGVRADGHVVHDLSLIHI